MQKAVSFLENHFYHIFNRENNKEIIFFDNENCKYFLKKFDYYLTKYLDLFVYCLLPNHFHFLIRVKENNSITSSDGIDKIISEQFRKFFLGYSQAINKQQNRSGSLFQKNFKRKLIDKESYLTRIIYYIHLNPTHHKISNNYKDYPWSSYKSIVNENPIKIKRQEVLKLFGDKNSLIELQNIQYDHIKEIENYLFE